MQSQEVLYQRFKNEAAAVYEIVSLDPEGRPLQKSPLRRYVASANGTRNMLNFPEILNRNFTDQMIKGLTYILIGIDRLENLSTIPSKHVNVFHLLRGSLNFRLVRALRDAFGYKWHSSSFISSQRVKVGQGFDVEDDAYRKFVIPESPTIYSGDIVATGASIDNSLDYLHNHLIRKGIELKNFVLVTIGCQEVEPVLERWHAQFQETFPNYERTILVYLEGRFGVARSDTPLAVVNPKTDLLRNYQLGSLHSPEFEYSQFEKVIIPMEGCVIYDGGKKSFEPVHHMEEIRAFWARQLEWAKRDGASLLDEYNRRFCLTPYFRDETLTERGDASTLALQRRTLWRGLTNGDYEHLYRRFCWLWTDERLEAARQTGSLATLCRKKLQYLDSHLHSSRDTLRFAAS